MGEIIAIINQKGGAGKTSTASSLGAGLRRKGFSVLFVDMDAQGNLSFSMGVERVAISSLEVLTGTATAPEAIMKTDQGDLIPSSPALASADAILTDTGKEYRLREALEPVREEYDYILLDTPPALGILTVNSLTACNGAIIPAQATAFSLQGIGQLSQTIQVVRKYCNAGLYIKGILITRDNPRTILSRDMTEMLESTAAQLHTKLYHTKIRENTDIKEAQAKQKDIFTYNPRSHGAEDYMAFTEEMLETEKGEEHGNE